MQKGFAPVFIIIGLLVVVLVGGGGYLYFTKIQTQQINSYEDCVKTGNKIQESYPAVCVTKDGKRFAQSLSDEEKKKLIPPTPIPLTDETVDWKTYTNKNLGIEFKYPAKFSYKESNNRSTSATVTQDTVRFEFEDKSFVFDKISNPESKVAPYQETNQTKIFNNLTWKVLIPNKDDKYCDGGECAGIAPSYYLFKNGYQYGFYYYSGDLKISIEETLSTFKFLE